MPDIFLSTIFVTESIMVDGEILTVLQKGSTNEYIFRWTTTVNLPVGVDHDHLVTRVLRVTKLAW